MILSKTADCITCSQGQHVPLRRHNMKGMRWRAISVTLLCSSSSSSSFFILFLLIPPLPLFFLVLPLFRVFANSAKAIKISDLLSHQPSFHSLCLNFCPSNRPIFCLSKCPSVRIPVHQTVCPSAFWPLFLCQLGKGWVKWLKLKNIKIDFGPGAEISGK